MDEKFIKLAELELRETESRRNQSLAQMREWIKKHPVLSKINQEDRFLLMFLRITKFDVNLSCTKMENLYSFVGNHPEYLNITDEKYARIIEQLVANRNIFSLSNRDEHGRKIVIAKCTLRDPKIYSTQDEIQTNAFTLFNLQHEHESQIAGFTIILDLFYIKPETAPTPAELNFLFGGLLKTSTMRIRKIIFINLSSWMMYLIEMVRFTLSSKMRERIVVIKEKEKIVDHIKPASILTKDLGGNVDEDDEFAKFFSLLKKHEYVSRKNLNPEIDWNGLKMLKSSKSFHNESENIGSFRKLEID